MLEIIPAEESRYADFWREARIAGLRCFAQRHWQRYSRQQRKRWRKRNRCRSPHLLLQQRGGCEI